MINELSELPQQLGFQSWFTFGLTAALAAGGLALILRKLDQRSKGEMLLQLESVQPALGAVVRGSVIIKPKKPLQIEALTLSFNGQEVHKTRGKKSKQQHVPVHTETLTLRQNFGLNPPQRLDVPFEIHIPICYKPTPSLADLNLDALLGDGVIGSILKNAAKSLGRQTLKTQWTLQAEAVMSGANFIESQTWTILVDPERLRRDWETLASSADREHKWPPRGIKLPS
ncbi:MAG TPA: hypothetical protein PLZ57_11385 [Pseudobdellovibrionaceae bacterium]|nr:hypothetical protein [Pseudobdellovibrionaceae bacterium]